MADILDFSADRVFVRPAERGWMVRIVEGGRRMDYAFERKAWAEIFARYERQRMFGR
ncbi:hypothetical protein [Kumtagia ephedrae]|jgi:hypothetical protein|uniref:hypothetical protein n=1 Tax=Kumtagia ephedrae TaxID=2116701 RepID=UPI001401E934|nr:hypothetical protein [Mesorhizobium ephedrae]